MPNSSIYSIGHGNKDINDFIAELQSFQIDFLLDVRSKPFSKWNPQFNQNLLAESLKQNSINYVFAGDTLGGMPEDRSCYDIEGKVDYNIIRQKAFFQSGIERLLVANSKNIKVAIMCSESKPEECHRSKLIGQELLLNSISIQHIIARKKIKNQELVMNELTKGKGTVNLFGEQIHLTSRKSY